MAEIHNYTGAKKPQYLPSRMEPETVTLTSIAEYGNLVIAHANAKRGKTHYTAVKRFEQNKVELLHKLSKALLSGEYQTSVYKNKIINDSGKERLISKLPYYPDRVAHWALMLQLEPRYMELFSKSTHASIKGRGIHTALYETRKILLHHPEESVYCLKIDVRKYFQHIDHDILKAKCRDLTSDTELLRHIYENIDSFKEGVPIGNYTSQYHANYYLTDFDHWLESKGYLFVRYMDDVVIFGSESGELHMLRLEIANYFDTQLKVDMKDNWQIFPVAVRGVDFVGYRIYPNRVILRKSGFLRIRRRMARVKQHLESGVFTTTDRGRIASDAGRIKYCTPAAKKTIAEKYLYPCLELLPASESKFKESIIKQVN